MKIEKLYKCRCCGEIFSIEEDMQFMTQDVPLVIKTGKCRCCLKTTNNTTIVIVADLTRYVFVNK